MGVVNLHQRIESVSISSRTSDCKSHRAEDEPFDGGIAPVSTQTHRRSQPAAAAEAPPVYHVIGCVGPMHMYYVSTICSAIYSKRGYEARLSTFGYQSSAVDARLLQLDYNSCSRSTIKRHQQLLWPTVDPKNETVEQHCVPAIGIPTQTRHYGHM